MANQDHLEILKEGVERWNAWRKTLDGPADLSDADLNGADLRGADLYKTDLSRTDLRAADLSEGVFDRSRLIDTDLQEANLSRARLRYAEISEVKLDGANLRQADLRDTRIHQVNLSYANDLRGVDLSFARVYGSSLHRAVLRDVVLNQTLFYDTNFSFADFRGANISLAAFSLSRDFELANFSGVNLADSRFPNANLRRANFAGADLRNAVLEGADLSEADLTEANLSHADLTGANLWKTKLEGAQLDGCRVYGTAVWDVSLDNRTSQRDLVITPEDEDEVTVDDLEIAQFMYLLLENRRIRKIIDTITSKVVLILGRFTEERKPVLDALRNAIRKHDFMPVLFDFEKPASRDLTETISTLAHMARFVIADITDAKSIPQELQKIVPNLPSLPIRPIILDTQYEYAMFRDFGGYLSVLPPYCYKDTHHLLESLEAQVIAPALNKATEIEERRKAFEMHLST